MIRYIKNILAQKCPRCHKGKMFTHKWYQLKNVNSMPKNCSVCGQRTELETGFYFGTGYVSYALTVAFSVATFIAWWVLLGISWKDSSVYHWLITNSVLLVFLQPWLMRISRVLWLSWFFHRDDEYHTTNTLKD